MWEALYEQLKGETVVDAHYPKPTDATIAAFESKTNTKLPVTYTEFIKVFGVGELAGYYRIAAPLGIEDDCDLLQQNQNAHGEPGEDLLGAYGPADVTDKLLIFANTIGGEMFAWNTGEVTHQGNCEYTIYHLTRRGSTQRIADTFEDFIQGYCLTEKPDQSGWVPPRTFFPY